MENQVKITLIEIENSKRIKAFAATPKQNGLTVIGGRNGQGKTSVLDNIAWALGGEKYRPSLPQREGLQAIATRVLVGDECSLIIEDGCVLGG